jgi:hypothetical protein
MFERTPTQKVKMGATSALACKASGEFPLTNNTPLFSTSDFHTFVSFILSNPSNTSNLQKDNTFFKRLTPTQKVKIGATSARACIASGEFPVETPIMAHAGPKKTDICRERNTEGKKGGGVRGGGVKVGRREGEMEMDGWMDGWKYS